MVIVILGMFVAAAMVGIVARVEAPEESPDAQAHSHSHAHDDHGAPHAHGH
jgi:hypothetical protein